MVKQLILFADMEGASGIFERNAQAAYHGSALWESYGRDCITSDVLAVCEGANDAGIDEILLYDGHFAGCPAYNVRLEKLPKNVRVFDVPDRCTFWRRIRGQAAQEPFGLITVGQHARYGAENAYFPHTVESPPIKAFYVNGKSVAELGFAALHFSGVPYLLNIGCAASMEEAKELCPTVSCVAVKDKRTGYEPSTSEVYPVIRAEAAKAVIAVSQKQAAHIKPPFRFAMELLEPYEFGLEEIAWKGAVLPMRAEWEAPSLEIGLELFEDVRALIKKRS